jgi:hypothetical protein
MERRLCEEFAMDQGVNPVTKRKIKIGGPTHQRIIGMCAKYYWKPNGGPPSANRNGRAPSPPTKKQKAVRDTRITPGDCEKFLKNKTKNPATGRTIVPGGAVYMKLRRACGEPAKPRSANSAAKKPSPKPAVAVPNKPAPKKKAFEPADEYKQTCLVAGFRQLSGTCWFNTGLNALVLGGRAGAFFRELSKATKVPASAHFANGAACPRKLTKDLVLGYMRRVYHNDFSVTPGGRYAKNHAARMLGKLGHIEGIDASGGKPLQGLMKIFGVAVPKSTYTLVNSPMDVYRTTDPAVKFAVAAPPGDSYYVWGNAPPKTAGKFHLDSAAIAIMFKDDGGVVRGHAVVGFFCGGFPYVFDSNRSTVVQFDWHKAMTDIVDRGKLFAALNRKSDGGVRYGTFERLAFPFYVYVRG